MFRDRDADGWVFERDGTGPRGGNADADSAVVCCGEVEKIKPYRDTGRYKVFLKGDPVRLPSSVGMGKNRHLKPQASTYARIGDVKEAKTLL